MPSGPLQHRDGQPGHAEAPGQLGHGRRRQRPKLQHPGDVGQGGERLGALLGPHGRQQQQAVAVQPVGEEVEQLEGGGARLVEVVDHQQHRLLGGQATEEPGDRLEGAAPFQLGRGPLVGRRVE
ncbi:MAG TPA: hypothetical protein VGM21_00475 [Actinomycetota bacterium]